MGAQQCCNDWKTQEGKRKNKNLPWCHGETWMGAGVDPGRADEVVQPLNCFCIVYLNLAVKAQWVFMAWTSSEVYLCIDEASCDKQCCLSISWNKPYPTLRLTWIEKCLHVLLCPVKELLPSQTLSLVKSRGESQRFLDMNGWRNGFGWLFESDLCVWVLSIVFPEAWCSRFGKQRWNISSLQSVCCIHTPR